MANAIRYSFVATGADQVRDAFKSIAQEAQRSAKATQQVHAGGTRAATGASQVARAEAKAAAQSTRIAQREAKEKERALKHVAGIRDRHFAQQQKQEERAERNRDIAGQRQHRSFLSRYNREAKAHEKMAALQEKANAKVRGERASNFSRMGISAVGLAAGAAITAGAVGASVLGAAARESAAVGESANRAAINSRLAGQEADPEAIKRSWEATAAASNGISGASIGEASLAYQSKTGKLADSKTMGVFATVAQGAGADIRDVAEAAAALNQQFKVESIDDFADALSALVVQGAKGSFELKDAAGQFEKLASAARRFGLDKGAKGVATLGGLTQLARSSTGSSEQAAFAVEATLRQLVAKSGDIKSKFGVNVFSDKGNTKTRDIQDVLVETIAGSKGDLTKLQDVFGEQGIRGISPLISTFNEARNGAAGSESEKTSAGVRALRDSLANAIDTTSARTLVEAAAASSQKDNSAKLSAAWENLVSSAGGALVPALNSTAEALIAMSKVSGVIAIQWQEWARAISREIVGEDTDAIKEISSPKAAEDMSAQIRKLESKGDLTPKEQEHLAAMKDAREAYDPVLHGGKSYGIKLPALDGMDAMDRVMRDGPVSAEAPKPGGDMGKGNESPGLSTEKAQTGLDMIAAAASKASIVLSKMSANAQASTDIGDKP